MTVTAALAACLVSACGSADSSPVAHSAEAAARSFLARYVAPDGRVVRHDQGGDTVSEGQGYALLVAVAMHEPGMFARVWEWTEQHLQQPSGLFAYHWADGKVADTMPATDADLQIAWALTLAGDRFQRPAWTAAARRIAAAILQHELGYDDHGRPVLAAGPWALQSGRPITVEPGYWTPPAEAALANLTGDNRWRDLAAADLTHLDALTRQSAALPPDWAQLGAGVAPHPVPTPSSGTAPQFALDAMRTLVWNSCTAGGRQRVAAFWPMLSGTAGLAPIARHLDGTPSQQNPNALSAVAAAAAAASAGHEARATALLRRADTIDTSYPTYYGAAWRALGWLLLTTGRLSHCS